VVCVLAEESPLQEHERPLMVQLNWGKDDREGRFLLKKETDATTLVRKFNCIFCTQLTAVILEDPYLMSHDPMIQN